MNLLSKTNLFILCLSGFLFGCQQQPEISSVASHEERGNEEEGFDDVGPYDDWFELIEPFGDESFLYYKVTPQKVVAGKPVKVQIHAGSGYGPVAGSTLSVRATAGSQVDENGLIQNPDEGNEWTALTEEGKYVQLTNFETDEETELRFAPEDEGYQQYAIDHSGHTNFEGTLTPGQDNQKIELRIRTPRYDNDQYMKAFADIAVDITPQE